MDEVKLKKSLSAVGTALGALALATARHIAAAPGIQGALQQARDAEDLIADLVKGDEDVPLPVTPEVSKDVVDPVKPNL